MSAWSPQPPPDDALATSASWRALSGDAPVPMPPQQPQPIHGGWQQPWQDAAGQWHYPYDAAPYAPQPAPIDGAVEPIEAAAAPALLVPIEQLQTPPAPRYLAPARVAQDPRRRTLAAVITFVSLLIALWAILGFMGALSDTLNSVSRGSEKLEVQLAAANKGLASLEEKTGHINGMAVSSGSLAEMLTSIDEDMGAMLTGVDAIVVEMEEMDAALVTLDTELAAVDEINQEMSSQLATISGGLDTQVGSVRTMRRDVTATGEVLGTLPGRLAATNGRLGFVNSAVNVMGCRGITNNLAVDIKLGPINNGSAKVFATVVPAGAWGTREDGTTPC